MALVNNSESNEGEPGWTTDQVLQTTSTQETTEDTSPETLYRFTVAARSDVEDSLQTEPLYFFTKGRKERPPHRDFVINSPAAATGDEATPTTVYHYTRTQGLLGIIGHKSLRATLLQYLNDDREYLYVYQQAISYLGRIRSLDKWIDQFGDLAAGIRRGLALPNSSLPMGEPGHRFTISFTELEDDLSQWRSYGRTGDSYAIGFRTSALEEFASSMEGWSFVRCVYGESPNSRSIIRSLTETFASYGHGKYDSVEAAIDGLRRQLANLAPVTKDPSFSAEKEWRLVSPPISVNDEDYLVKYREGSNAMIPYIDVPLPAGDSNGGTLSKVVVGPGPSLPAAVLSTVGMLASHRIHIGVMPTRAPFRTV